MDVFGPNYKNWAYFVPCYGCIWANGFCLLRPILLWIHLGAKIPSLLPPSLIFPISPRLVVPLPSMKNVLTMYRRSSNVDYKALFYLVFISQNERIGLLRPMLNMDAFWPPSLLRPMFTYGFIWAQERFFLCRSLFRTLFHTAFSDSPMTVQRGFVKSNTWITC